MNDTGMKQEGGEVTFIPRFFWYSVWTRLWRLQWNSSFPPSGSSG